MWRSLTLRVCTGLLAAGAGLVAPVAAQECLELIPPLLLDTSAYPDLKNYDRTMGVQIIHRGSHRYLAHNIGNELEIMQLDNPLNPTSAVESRLGAAEFGDRDYNLFNFTLCDDCRYGLAGFQTVGTVLFDLDSESGLPHFGDKLYYPSARNLGGFTFKHGSQQYLIASNLLEVCGGGAALMMFNGVQPQNLTFLQCVNDASGMPLTADGGYYIPDPPDAYVYLVGGSYVYTLKVTGSGAGLGLEYRGQFMRASWQRFRGLDVDLDAGPYGRLAAVTNLQYAEIWDLDNPDDPNRIARWDPSPPMNPYHYSIAMEYPYLWLASSGGQGTGFTYTYDITDPTSPQPLDVGFWDSSQPWNSYAHGGNIAAEFTADANYLFLSRWSVMERIEFGECVSQPVVANFSVSPVSAFPGDQVRVTNTSTGAYNLSAVWITDAAGWVAGSTTMQSGTPSTLDFTVPADLGWLESYTVNVAVSSPDYFCDDPFTNPELCGDRLKSGVIDVNRYPEAKFVVTPATVVTGETVTLNATSCEGHPTSWEWDLHLDGGEPPGGQPSPAQTTQYVLSESGTWTFDLTAGYPHQSSALGTLYSDDAPTVTRAVSSVAAAYSYTPTHPLGDANVYLCSDSNASPDIAQGMVLYDWVVDDDAGFGSPLFTSDQCYTTISQCDDCGVVLSEALFPDDQTVTYHVKLTLTNDDEGHGGYGDTSEATGTMTVYDSSVNVDFSISDTTPNIGQTVTFLLTGTAGGVIQSATWSFGGPGCSTYSTPATCTPGGWVTCETQPYQYSTSGQKQVSVTVRMNNQDYPVGPKTLTVQSGGTCTGATCSYTIYPTAANVSAAGVSGSLIAVTATPSTCQWTATTATSWIHITAGSSGTGNGNVVYNVDANSGSSARSGTISAAGKTFTVSQAGNSTPQVDFTISDTTPDIGQTVTFYANSDCANPLSWYMGGAGCDGADPSISCSSAPALCRAVSWKYASSGGKSVTLTCAEGSQQKTLTVSSSGQCEVPCDKDGPPDASFTMSPNPVLLGETVTFTDTSSQQPKVLSANFTWTPTSPQIGALVSFAISGVSDTVSTEWDFGAPGCTGYSQAATCTPTQWSCTSQWYKYGSAGTFTVTLRVDGGNPVSKSITVQDIGTCGGGGCTYSLSSSSASAPAEGGTGSVTVTTQESCTYSAQSNASWLHVTSGSSYVGSDTVSYSVDANSGVQRSGSLTIAGHYFSVTQAAGGGGGDDDTDPTSWSWTVKLGGQTVATSNQPSFSHAFTSTGEYNVTLVATNCKGSDTATQTLVVYEEVAPEEFMVPAVAHGPGMNNTVWRSDLRIFNPGGEPILTGIEYRPRDEPMLVYGVEATIADKGTLVFDDVTEAFHLEGDEHQGSLRISFEGGDGTTPVLMSRTYNLSASGTYGQYIPAVPVLPPDSGQLYLTGLSHNAEYRTNLLLANLGAQDVGDITVRILDQDGTELGEKDFGVPANSSILIVGIAGEAGVTGDLDLFSIQVDIGDKEVTAAASVIDQTTGDPVLYSPELVEEGPVYLPGVAHLPGALGSQWRSDLTLFNPSEESIVTRVDYVPEVALSLSYYLRVELPARESFKIKDVIGYLVGYDANTKGYLVVAPVDESASPLVAARTYNQAATGTYGQNLEAFSAADLVAAGETRYLPGVASGVGVGFRTNLGLVNTSQTGAAAVDIVLYGKDGTVLGQIPSYGLQAKQFAQFDPFQAVEQEDLDTYGSLAIHVVSGGPVAAYASVVDNGTQDPILIPALLAY